VTAVRPPIFPPSQAAQPARTDAGRLAAQKAFFDLALGKAAAPAQMAAAPAPSPTPAVPAAAPRIPEAGLEKPQKILRPGSLLDIRV
jgi:hypothetical protein